MFGWNVLCKARGTGSRHMYCVFVLGGSGDDGKSVWIVSKKRGQYGREGNKDG